jgi:hypothetical protein
MGTSYNKTKRNGILIQVWQTTSSHKPAQDQFLLGEGIRVQQDVWGIVANSGGDPAHLWTWGLHKDSPKIVWLPEVFIQDRDPHEEKMLGTESKLSGIRIIEMK